MQFALVEAVTILQRTPAALAVLLAPLPPSWTDANEGGESWSAFDIVGHLVHGERTDWVPRARIILEHGPARAFEPFDRFAQLSANRGRMLHDLIEDFARERSASLKALAEMRLTPQLLDRPGRHPELGAVTLRQLLATWVVHDLGHLAQVSRVLAKQYAGEVGAWHDYLPVLADRPASG